MPRKGSRKTRTGCITCNRLTVTRIRKVKCDEAKPTCNRCTATGRHCDGYLPGHSGSANSSDSELSLHRPASFPGIKTAGESRALQYFCQTAGPQLSGAVDPFFMSKLVMQFTSYEPAARHSVLAISTLAEQLQKGLSGQAVRLREQTFALHHYNAAIQNVRSLTSTDTHPVVLLVCILFICIELLQENRGTFIQHCKHGFSLLQRTASEYAWTRHHLLPLFRRVAISAFLWTDDPADFPELAGLEHPVPDGFFTFADAQVMIDDLFSRTLRLVRRGDPYRIDPENSGAPPQQLLAAQTEILLLLDQWKRLLEEFEARPPSPPGRNSPGTENLTKTLRFILQCRYESCRAWAETALSLENYDHEKYLAAFDRIFDDLGITDPEFRADFRRSPTTMCDAGYVPIITLTSAKCSHLDSRLSALNLIPVSGLPREALCLAAHAWGCSGVTEHPQIIQTPHDDMDDSEPNEIMQTSTI